MEENVSKRSPLHLHMIRFTKKLCILELLGRISTKVWKNFEILNFGPFCSNFKV